MAEDLIELHQVNIEPNNCRLEEPLHIDMEFTTKAPLENAFWEVKFIADQAHKRKIVLLGETPPTFYGDGLHTMSFDVDAIDVSNLSRVVLANVGLLLAVLHGERDGQLQEIVQVSMVTQVTANGSELVRSIFNPLE
jgi:hypothetical protein